MTYGSASVDMRLSRALRLTATSSPVSLSWGEGYVVEKIAFVGAGGKTTAIFKLARELLASTENITKKIIVTATSHLGVWQIPLADHHFMIDSLDELGEFPDGVTLITGALAGDRTLPINPVLLSWLCAISEQRKIPILIEADGARERPLKAPAVHEPPIPDFVSTVVVVAGLNGLGNPLTEEYVFRSQCFRELHNSLRLQTNGKMMDHFAKPAGHEVVTPEMLVGALTHPEGGVKNIPPRTRRVVLLNQAESPELLSAGGQIAQDLLSHFDSALVGSLHQDGFYTFEQTAGIILAAGESNRFGAPKQLLNWNGKPFVRHVAETALHARLWPVIIVTGSHSPEVEAALEGLPVTLVHNKIWQSGQASSIVKGVLSLPKKVGSTIFLLADQPQIPVEIIRALVESHIQNLPAILAPLVQGEKRANPVLFDRSTFPDLLTLTGDIGGRAIFDRYLVEYLPWHDDVLLFDVDTPQDYKRLTGQ